MNDFSPVSWRRTVAFYVAATIFSLIYAYVLLCFFEPNAETAIFVVSMTFIMPVANRLILMRNANRRRN